MKTNRVHLRSEFSFVLVALSLAALMGCGAVSPKGLPPDSVPSTHPDLKPVRLTPHVTTQNCSNQLTPDALQLRIQETVNGKAVVTFTDAHSPTESIDPSTIVAWMFRSELWIRYDVLNNQDSGPLDVEYACKTFTHVNLEFESLPIRPTSVRASRRVLETNPMARIIREGNVWLEDPSH
jgi:hypothetical protein